MTIYADHQLMEDMWESFYEWLRQYQHIEGLYGLHVPLPITPRAVAQGVAKGGNALGLEDAGNRTLSGM